MGVADEEMDGRGWDEYPKRGRPIVRFGAIGAGWDLFRLRWGTWMTAVLVVLVCNSAAFGMLAAFFRFGPARGGFGGFRFPMRPDAQLLQAIVSTIINGFFLGGMFRMACDQVRGLVVRVETLFSVVDVLPELILGSALYALAVSAGFTCLILPGLVAAGVLMFTTPLIVDGRLPALSAISQSWRALQGQWLTATAFHLVLWAIAGSGSCFCCVGLLFTAPLYSLSIAVLYRDFFLAKSP